MKKIILIATIFFTVMTFSSVFATGNTVNSGWVNVTLTDTQFFDPKCEYRAWSKLWGRMKYAVSTEDSVLLLMDASSGASRDGLSTPYTINYKTKGLIKRIGPNRPSTPIAKIEKRCKLPDTAPPGMIGQFALAQCPDGWSTWLFAKATVECNTSNCKIAVCKKD
jgi:hypothetical protein